MSPSRVRQSCSCGTRLARDNDSGRCAACHSKTRDVVVCAPVVPATFWADPQLQEAFASWHMGRVVAAYRHHHWHGPQPLPQQIVAGWADITQAQLSRIENGPPIRDLHKLIRWAHILGIPADLLWFKLPHQQQSPSRQPVDRRSVPGTVPTSPDESVNSFRLVQMGVEPSPDADVVAMRTFRAADQQVGGGHLYPAVVNYLHTDVAPRLFGAHRGQSGSDGAQVFTAAAALTEMAGWMAHDAGHDTHAEHHFHRALNLASVGKDRALHAHILVSMAHLAHHQGRPQHAISLARSSQRALTGAPSHPALQAQALAMQARGYATLRQPRKTTTLLQRAEKTLQQPHGAPVSEWVNGFDEGSLASEAARCMTQLGHFTQAHHHAQRIITLRPPSRVRARAFAHLTLATVLIQQGEPEQACTPASYVIEATNTLGSYVVMAQLVDVAHLLQPHHTNTVVGEFLDQLNHTLHQHNWPYQHLAPHSGPTFP